MVSLLCRMLHGKDELEAAEMATLKAEKFDEHALLMTVSIARLPGHGPLVMLS